ncbi:hypothetical protein N3114_05545 [Aliarcobacter butzleri]|jgi:hypothetical protein|uniref:hypothetical protein n=1 Tax=Aliarcobacter butzleri TaxID=28197 RepID=UPI0021B37EFF|nr:hypothetical protein [Aliarcobacter butzleri]UXC30482.1 hypothetical protein N3114_05545 [Aliarcobacter butzleri]
MFLLKIKERKKDQCLDGINTFKISLRKYLTYEQKHIIPVLENFEKRLSEELIVDLKLMQKIRDTTLEYDNSQLFLNEEFNILTSFIFSCGDMNA